MKISFEAHKDRVEGMVVVEGNVWTCSNKILVWDAKTYKQSQTCQSIHQHVIKRLLWVSINPDHSYVWSGDVKGKICIWDVQVGFFI